MKATAAAVSFALALSAATAPDHSALNSIDVGAIKSDLYFLASDQMRGRALGTPANARAAQFIAERFASLGLRPAGVDGFYQDFAVVQSSLAEPCRLRLRGRGGSVEAKLLNDFFPSPLSADGRASGSLVFAGYGITAPEFGYDDYAGLEARGKVVLVLDHEPGEDDFTSPFDGVVLTDYGRELHKILNAQRRGAVGLIIAEDEANHQRSGGIVAEGRRTWPKETQSARHHLKLWTDQIRIPAVFLSAEKAELLLGDQKLKDLQKAIDSDLRPRSFPLPQAEARLTTTLRREEKKIRNVLGALPGSDPALADEWVVVGAHFDHVGIDEEEVFNGADDDASGTAGLLSVAKAFAAGRTAPRRSILFAAWNAEESGLLGSYYFVARPTVALDKAAAMLQMDMIGRNEEVSDPANFRFRGLPVQTAEQNRNAVNILGYSKSPDLRRLAEEANRTVGLDLHFRYDNQELGLLRRSDNWPFLTRGVPALFFHTGLHPDYHRPTDTADKINYPKMAKVVRLVFLSAWELANQPSRPALGAPERRP